MSANFQYSSTPYSGFNPYQGSSGTTQSMKGVYDKILGDVMGGRPGSIDYLLNVLSGLGQSQQGEMGYHQYASMAPYMTDPAQAQRYEFQTMAPYMTDEANRARQRFGWESQDWAWKSPYLKERYNQQIQDLQSPYRSVNAWSM